MDTNIKDWLPKWIFLSIGVLVILFLVLTVADKFHLVQQDFKPQTPPNTISISADGKVTAAPDLATVSLGVLTTDPTAAQAEADNTKKINSVTDFVKQQGVAASDITTRDLNVSPQYDYSNGQNKITGYQASQSISVKVHNVDKSTAQVSSIIGGATDAGANEVDGVTLDFENPDNLKEQAREMAIDNAKQKAQDLADKAGLKLGKIVSISESDSNPPTPLPFAVNSLASGIAAAPSTPPEIQTGTQDITETMTVVFGVEN